MTGLRLALAEINVSVGDLAGNAARIIESIAVAQENGCAIVAVPELALTGYPPEDLLLKPSFVDDNLDWLQQIASATTTCIAMVGFVDRSTEEMASRRVPSLYNVLAICAHGEILSVYRKRRLPNYAVFDEDRYFAPGGDPLRLIEVDGVRVGVAICEDAWWPDGPICEQGRGGAELIITINASPYHRGKQAERLRILQDRVAESGCAIANVNLVGGQDELVFDGGSVIVDPGGALVARAPQFGELLLIADIDVPPRHDTSDPLPVLTVWRDHDHEHALERHENESQAQIDDHVQIDNDVQIDDHHEVGARDEPVVRAASPPMLVSRARHADAWGTPEAGAASGLAAELDPVREVYEALVLGTRDYVRKNAFSDVVIGLSGGVDSSLVAAIAVDALGADHVHGVLMPSRYSSDHSITDADALADHLGIDRRTIAIESAYGALTGLLAPSFKDREPDLTEENIQSRIRGVLLMALSNKFGWMVLTTSNKSESAVGYSTLYGDSAGGYAVIKDAPKLLVYDLCRSRNEQARDEVGHDLIPDSVLTKPPSAELRPDQRDDQSLPPYEVLDPIIEAYVEQDRTVTDLIDDGFDEATVRRICRLIDLAEYKRRQFPPGPRITTKAFGKDRRLPITNLYRG